MRLGPLRVLWPAPSTLQPRCGGLGRGGRGMRLLAVGSEHPAPLRPAASCSKAWLVRQVP